MQPHPKPQAKMRVSFFATILPIALSLASLTAARGYDSGLTYEARDYIDELSTRDQLSSLTTRELIDELSDRLERRGGSKYSTPVCTFCLKTWLEGYENIKCSSPNAKGKNHHKQDLAFA
ncbi:hypothetical protein D9611_007341 [Ephemerocybe angulata]|uniref:Uncharacterized protein n=1 Tax=Ephemerocybe angulata TaxID=980116 RepID=A0A8H5CGZ6_9AGAR|nr:hypothetical protein D9611_007341 [Tulosesus angulatus]